MKQYETMLHCESGTPEDAVARLNELGKQGWKLVHVSPQSRLFWLVREKPSVDTQPAD